MTSSRRCLAATGRARTESPFPHRRARGPAAGLLALICALAFVEPASAATPGVRPLPRTGVPVEIAALLLSGQEGGAFELALLAVPSGDPMSGQTWVDLLVETNGAALLAAAAPGTAGARGGSSGAGIAGDLVLDLAVYALRDGGVTTAIGRAWALDSRRLREAIEATGLRLATRLALPAGSHELRILVRAGAAVAVRRVTVVVPPAGASAGSPTAAAPPTASEASLSASSAVSSASTSTGSSEAASAPSPATDSAAPGTGEATPPAVQAAALFPPPLLRGHGSWVELLDPHLAPRALPDLRRLAGATARPVLVPGEPTALAAPPPAGATAWQLELRDREGEVVARLPVDAVLAPVVAVESAEAPDSSAAVPASQAATPGAGTPGSTAPGSASPGSTLAGSASPGSTEAGTNEAAGGTPSAASLASSSPPAAPATWAVRLDSEILPGRYRLRWVSAAGPEAGAEAGAGEAAQASTPIDVVVALRAEAWPRLGAPPPVAATAARDQAVKVRKVSAARLRETLITALLADAQARPAEGTALAAWQVDLLLGETAGALGPVDPEAVDKAEAKVVEVLGKADPEALPVLARRLIAARDLHLEQRRYWLVARIEPLVRGLLERYVGAGGDRRLTADALTALGGRLSQLAQRSGADTLATRALEAVPGHPGALLLLAQNAEFRADPGAAAWRLRDEVRRDELGGHRAEARLRLGVALRRTGERGRADAELLAAAAEVDAPAWVREVAWEERLGMRVRGELPAGDLAPLLGAARTALPASRSIRLLAAAHRVSLGDLRGARQLLAELTPPGSAVGVGPRGRYSELPAAVGEAEEAFFAGAAAREVGYLAAVERLEEAVR